MPQVLVFCEDVAVFSDIVSSLPPNVTAVHVSQPAELGSVIREHEFALLVFEISYGSCRELLDLPGMRSDLERLPLVLLARDDRVSVSCLSMLIKFGPQALVSYPFAPEQFRSVLVEAFAGAVIPPQGDSLGFTLADTNRRLNARLQEINTIYTVGKSVASSLDVDEILELIVAASVNLTQADDGFIVLREGSRLFLRVAKSRDEQTAQQLCQETSDPVAWQVIQSGLPTMLHRDTRIATGFLVRALLYVPLQSPSIGTIGILGVVNRDNAAPFNENQLFTLSSVADFAAIGLENARLFTAGEAERSRLSAILERAAEAIIVTDPSNHLWLWSETAGRALGIDRGAQGQLLWDAIGNADICDLFAQASRDTSVLQAEVILEDGRIFNAQLSTIESVGNVAVMHEITHLKELDRLRSEFVSTVSHDLRSPLTTIQGYVELLDRAGPLNQMQRQFVNKALDSLTHVTALISDLLDIGRIEAGYDLKMQPIRFDDLIRTTAEASQVYAAQEGIALAVELPEVPLWVWGNTRRLRQVLENLLSNAIKYNRPMGWVKVAARRDGEYTIVLVTDGGIGIPPEEQTRIFERFYRVQSPETETITGTGLGLAIVRSVIEKHKGRVWVESTPGEGSAFAFVLPNCDPTD